VLKGNESPREEPTGCGRTARVDCERLWRNVKLEERMKLIALNDDQWTPTKENRTAEARANDKTGSCNP
jgi:hypothetical protein